MTSFLADKMQCLTANERHRATWGNFKLVANVAAKANTIVPTCLALSPVRQACHIVAMKTSAEGGVEVCEKFWAAVHSS